MLSKYLRWTIVAGLFAVVIITPFYVSRSMFFPFITGKGFFFRIIVEIIFGAWIVLAMVDKRYRPKFSPVLWSAVAVLSVLTLSTIFGENPYRSFWSNYERMEGLISHFHLFAYFLVLSSMLKSAVEWRRFFYAISVSGAAMALYGYLQAFGITAISVQSGLRVDGTFGNAGYMAVFILMNVFLASFLFLTEKRGWLKKVFAGLVMFEIPVVFLTATRGAILGLLGGFMIFALLFTIFSKDKRFRWAGASSFGGVILLVAVFLTLQNTAFVKNNYVLQRFSNLDFTERTVQSRFIIWGMSVEGFKERPILGWGIENYNQVFNKYYEPELWLQEPWFDRAHNIIFDWLISGGILGILAYLSFFVSAFYVLWKKYIQTGKNPVLTSGKNWVLANLALPAVFTALLSAYFFHNFFVFDNLVSYILFFSILAFVHWYWQIGKNLVLNGSVNGPLFTPAHSFAAAVLVFALIFGIYFINVKPILANTWLLQALKDANSQGHNVDLILSDFEKSIGYRTFGTGEAREQLSAYANAVHGSTLPQSEKDKVNTFSIQELEKAVLEDSQNARSYLFLSGIYSNMGRHEDALQATENALTLSPQKQQILFLLADIRLSLGDGQGAYEAVKTAYELDKSYSKAAINLAIIGIVVGRVQEAETVLIETFGTTVVADITLVSAYSRIGNYERVRDIWLKLIENNPENAQYRVNLAATYMKLGDTVSAIESLEHAIELNPSFKEQGEFFINEIKAGRNPAS